MEQRRVKPYVGLILIVLYAIDIFWLSGMIGNWLGFAGTVIHELILLLIAVGIIFLFGGDFKRTFPFKKPQTAKVFGTLILWLGAFGGTMMITIIIAYFFPSEVFGVSQGLGSAFMTIPLFLSFLVISVTPAICEEMAFRGALLSCFRSFRSKWVIIILVSVIFGAFHGSIWRFVPTTLLGIAMGYLLLETDNMFYNMLFHLVNNALPLALLAFIEKFYGALGMGDAVSSSASSLSRLPLASVGVYLIYGAAAPFLIYIGNFLLHKGQPGYDRGLFPREKRSSLLILILVGLGLMFMGICLTLASFVFDQGLIEEIYRMM